MTLPHERTRAVQNTREFMRDLLDPRKTPRIPRAIRKRAYWCLKHYPHDYELREAAIMLPVTWGKPKESTLKDSK